MMKRLLWLLCFALLVGAVQAQDDQPIRVETNLVSINVAVTDSKGNYVKNLQQDQFEIFDNGVKQQIDFFPAESAPVTFGIVYDLHPTTTERTTTVLNALRQFTRKMDQKDDFFSIVFNENGSLVLDFVPDIEQVTKHLSSAKPNTPSSLYDAIYLAAGKIRESKNVKRTLLIISDGTDHSSHHSFKELRRRLRNFNVQVYAVAIEKPESSRWVYSDLLSNTRRRTFTENNQQIERAVLDELSRTSGGASYTSALESSQVLYGICNEIAADLSQQYTIGFYPDQLDGKWHKLQVRLRSADGKRLKLSYRKGYQSAQENR